MTSLAPHLRVLAAGLLFVVGAAGHAQTLGVQLVTGGLTDPLLVTAPPGDPRLFIVQQNGVIRIFSSGSLLATPFLDISGTVACCGERGLLGMAFHPNYASNGFFYISHTNSSGNSMLRRFSVSGNPNVASTAGIVTIYGPITQPFSNHNGGCIAFGPDGMLYLGLGDGGSAGDPGDRAQNTGTPLGKMLRFNVDIAAPHIPLDNPFRGAGNPLDEIWAIGLRNPWRFSFDRGTGDLYIADVGQGSWEEIDFQPASSTGGENYGWRCREGANCFTTSTGCTCATPTLVDPIHEFSHAGGNCSVTGGYVYRGNAIPCLKGTYFFGDYCSARIWSLRYEAGVVSDFQERTAQLAIPGSELITSFGEGADGELYIVDASGGEVWRIIDASGTPRVCGDCATPTDQLITILDAFEAARIAVLLVTPGVTQTCVCDTNNDSRVDVLDAFAMALLSTGLPVVLSCP